jgi:putative peptidoglycan lipid II flippase
MTSSPELASVAVAGRRGSVSAGRAAFVATAMTLASYGATLVQQMVYARALGVSSDTDALAVALAWALGIAGLIGTTFVSVVVPLFVRRRSTNPGGARTVFQSATALALAATGLLALVTVLGRGALAAGLSPGAAVHAQVADLLLLATPLLIIWTLVAVGLALANSMERYGLAAASGIAPSLVVIVALVVPQRPTVEIAMGAYILGGLLQIAWLAFIARAELRALMPLPDRRTVLQIARLAVPLGVAFAILNAAALIQRAIASLGTTGDVAIVDYASRLVLAGEQAVLAGVLAVMLTTWSLDAAQGASARLPIGRTIGGALGLLLPAAALLAILAPEIVALLYGGGRFAELDVQRVATVLRWMSLGIAAHMVLMLAFRALLAHGASWSIAGVGLLHVVVLVLVGIPAQAAFGVDGVAMAYSIGWIAALVVSLAVLRPRFEHGSAFAGQLVATCTATIAASAAAVGALSFIPASSLGRFAVGLLVFSVAGWIAGHITGVDFVRIATHRGLAFASAGRR